MRLWFDTNVLWRKFSEQRAIAELARSRGLVPAVSAQVYLEDRRQTRLRFLAAGRPFLEREYDRAFAQLYEIVDVPFARATAALWADRLAERYPGRDAWRSATRATLGGKLRAQFEELPARVPMTTDWWVALAVEDDAGSRVVCNESESGEEWRFLRDAGRVLTWEGACAWLEALPAVDAG